MRYTYLARTGIKVSRIGLGTYNFGSATGEDEARKIWDLYRTAGGNFLDTSNSYSDGRSESIVGRIVGKAREDVVIATKVGWPVGEGANDGGSSRLHIERQVRASCARLGIDCIDLLQLHRPDRNCDIAYSLRALGDLQKRGQVRHYGTSTFFAWQIANAHHIAATLGLEPPICEQPPYNLLDRRIEAELLPCCEELGIAVVTWGALAGGILAGRYGDVDCIPPGSRAALSKAYGAGRLNRAALDRVAKMQAIARRRSLSLAQLALLWSLSNPRVAVVLIGPRTADQLAELLAVADGVLDADAQSDLDLVCPPAGYVSRFYEPAMAPAPGV